MAIAYKDSLYDLGRVTSFEDLIAYDAQERQNEIDTANATYRSQVKQYVLMAGLVVFLLIAFMLYRNNRQKQKAKVKIEKASTEELKIHPIPTHPIRKDGHPWRTHRRHCP